MGDRPGFEFQFYNLETLFKVIPGRLSNPCSLGYVGADYIYLLEMILRINCEAIYIGHLTQSLTHRNSTDGCFHSSSL